MKDFRGLAFHGAGLPICMSALVPGSRTPWALDFSSAAMAGAWKMASESSDPSTINQVVEEWAGRHTLKSVDPPKPSPTPADNTNAGLLCMFDSEEAIVTAMQSDADAAAAGQGGSRGQGRGKGKKAVGQAASEKYHDKHKKCRLLGVQACLSTPLQKLRIRMTAACRAMCQMLPNLKSLLIDGFIVWSLRSGQGVREFWHLSFVFGGLQQFHPVFTRCRMKQTSGADEAAEWPDRVRLQAETEVGNVLDYLDALQTLDINDAQTLHMYKLVDERHLVRSFCPSVIDATKLPIPPYVAWKGLAAYRKPKQQKDPQKHPSRDPLQLKLPFLPVPGADQGSIDDILDQSLACASTFGVCMGIA